MLLDQILRDDLVDRRWRRRRWPRPARLIDEKMLGDRSRSTSWHRVRVRPVRHGRDRVPVGRRGGEVLDRAGERRSSTRTPLRRGSRLVRYRRRVPGGAVRARSTTWTSPRSRSSAWRRALIPFLEHDDANRALMGSQHAAPGGAAPLARSRRSSAPAWSTGGAFDSRQVVVAQAAGDGGRRRPPTDIQVERDEGDVRDTYPLQKFLRSNQDTCINQRPIVDAAIGSPRRQVIADSSIDREGRAGARPEHPGRLHAAGRAATTRTRSSSASAWCATTCSPRSTSRSTRSRPATPSWVRRRSRATSRTSARTASATSTRTGSSRSAPRSARRHPGRQDHAEGRDRADGRGAPAARDLR